MIQRVPITNTAPARPGCWGEAKYHDPKDPECYQQCHYFQTCGVRVRALAGYSPGTAAKAPVAAAAPKKHPLREDADDLHTQAVQPDKSSWGKSLSRNIGLRAISASLREAAYAVEQIPMAVYSEEEKAAQKK